MCGLDMVDIILYFCFTFSNLGLAFPSSKQKLNQLLLELDFLACSVILLLLFLN
jgi:hypothetical protein